MQPYSYIIVKEDKDFINLYLEILDKLDEIRTLSGEVFNTKTLLLALHYHYKKNGIKPIKLTTYCEYCDQWDSTDCTALNSSDEDCLIIK